MPIAAAATRQLRTAAGALRSHLRNVRTYESVRSPFATLWIDPSEVRNKVLRSYRELPPGTILAGDWDLEVVGIEESPKYQGLVEHFQMGLPWEETCLFQSRYLDRLNRHGVALGMRSVDELAEYYRGHVDRLFRVIEKDGFQPGSLRKRIHPVYAHIRRNGEFIWGTGGNHRFAIARILGLRRIPIRIHLRHEQWQRYRDDVARGRVEVSSRMRTHADLSDILRSA